MKGVILHGGYGNRLRPLTHTGPKQLIPIANKPISQYVLEDLKNSGITEIAVILGETNPEKAQQCYSDGQEFGVKITYINQGEPKGIAHAVSLCEEYVGNEIENIKIAEKIFGLLDKPKEMIRFVEDRPGHDVRHSLGSTKIRTELGCSPRKKFNEALKKTVEWYKSNEQWWKPLINQKSYIQHLGNSAGKYGEFQMNLCIEKEYGSQ